MARRRQLGAAHPLILPLPPYLMGLSANPFKRLTKRQKLLIGGGIALIAIVAFNRERIAAGAIKAATKAKGALDQLLTANVLRKAMPGVKATQIPSFIGPLVEAMDEAEINTPARIAAFLAQTGMESGDFRYFEEIASGDDYEGREDLGNTRPGDGRRYKGRGPIQLTGRANYAAFTRDIGTKYGVDFEQNPELLLDPKWGFKASAWFWKKNKLNQYADEGRFNRITYGINGGCHGYWDRDRRYAVAKKALGIESMPEIKEFNVTYRKKSDRFGLPAGTYRATCGTITRIIKGATKKQGWPIPDERTKSGDDPVVA
jgi:predicted chitinase